MTNAHPPLPSIYLALWWKVSGFYPEVTREAVLMVAALALLGVWRLAMRLVGADVGGVLDRRAHGALSDLVCAKLAGACRHFCRSVFVVGTRVCAAESRPQCVGRCPLVRRRRAVKGDGHCDSSDAGRNQPRREGFWRSGTERWRLWREAAWLSRSCILPLAAWYGYHYAKSTGIVFGNPEFLRYNAQATLTPLRILAAFGHRILHLTAHMNMFVPVFMALAAMLLNPRKDSEGNERPAPDWLELLRIAVLLLVNAMLFSVLGGALLTRYLLPMYPLVLLVAVSVFYRRVPYWHGLAVVSAAAFIVGLFINPPYGFAPEDNLAYARVVRMHQSGIAQLAKRYPGATVLTAWPMTDELRRPELGYVKHAWDVCAIEDFTSAQIERAADEPSEFLRCRGLFNQVRSADAIAERGWRRF